MTTADDIAAIFRNEAAPTLMEAFGADTFVVKRSTRTKDGRGGEKADPAATVPQPEYLVGDEDLSNRCRLYTVNRDDAERVAGEQVVGRSRYAIDLPPTADVRKTDTIVVNGTRSFAIAAIQQPGNIGVFLTLAVEDRP